MLHRLTQYEVLEIHGLIAFKTASLTQSKLFLETVKGHIHAGLLVTDINRSIQEIIDLRNLLVHSNH